jgi:hypothetical protein
VDRVLTVLYRLIETIVSLAGNVPGFTAPHAIIVLLAALGASGLIMYVQNRDSAKRRKIAPFII